MKRIIEGLTAKQVMKTERYLIGSEIRSLNLEGNNGRIIWHPLNSEEPSQIVVEKIIKGYGEELTELLEKIEVEELVSDTKYSLKVIQPRDFPRSARAEVNFIVYAAPEQLKEFQARTSNGSIEIVADFSCSLDLKTSNGAIILNTGQGALNIATSNGQIHLGQLVCTASSSIKSSNGRIFGNVSFPQSGCFNFETSNGGIDLKIPEGFQGDFDLATSNGKISYPFEKTDTKNRSRIKHSTGIGPTIICKTSNGNVRIEN